jgi:hypothetical protein
MRWHRSIALAAALLAGAGAARADEPWAIGVTDEQKRQAQALLDEGNTRFLDGHYPDALAIYRRALAIWDHPAIRFNIVRCLIQLERPVEAYDELEQALRFGHRPLAEAVYQEALGYQKLLAGQIAELEVRCRQPDVAVTIDGQHVLTCPGQARRRFAPGTHQVVARRAGYLTLTRDVIVLPAAPQQVDVTLVSMAAASVTVRRWAWWKPWAVVGGGAAVALIGGLVEWRASADYDEYDRVIAVECGQVGCDQEPAAAAELRARARLEDRIGVATLAVGGVGLAVGAALAVLNRGRIELPSVEIMPAAGGASAVVRLTF